MTPDGSKRNGDSPNGRSARDALAVLVTGGAGFIGSHLCERLLEEGHRVWALDNFDDFYDPGRKRKNLALALREPTMHLVEGDVRDEILLDGLMSDVDFDAVVHLAALPGVRASLENPDLCFDVNVRGTLRLLEAMRRHSVPVLVFGSSSSVYGEATEPPFREDAAADRPISPYAASKRAGEMLCHVHHHLYGLNAYCLRFFTVYGPRQRPDLAIHKFARLMAAGKPLPLYGDGSSERDYTYIDDAIDGIVRSLTKLTISPASSDRPAFEIVNIGNNQTVSLENLVAHLETHLDMTAEVAYVGEQPGDVAMTHASGDRARQLLNYAAGVDIADGLQRFASWFRTHHQMADGDRQARKGPTARDGSSGDRNRQSLEA